MRQMLPSQASTATPFMSFRISVGSRFASQTELVSHSHRLVAVEIDLQQFFTLDRAAFLIGQFSHYLARFDFNHIAGRGISKPSVKSEGHPARLIAQPDAVHQLWRQDGCI